MSKGTRTDVSRQVAVLLGAVFQILVAIAVGPAVGRVSGENPTLVVPGDYAFVIWTPIFLLALIYAAYAALPANRTDPLLRRVGWFSALAYLSNGVWMLSFPAREFALSQVIFVGITGGAVLAFVLAQRGIGSGSRAERWLVSPSLGLLAGWVTAAFFVGFVTVLVATGALSGGGAFFGASMLVVGGSVACAVILAGRNGPAPGTVAYGGAVLWALAGVIANQYQSSLVTTSTAAVCALVVAAILFVSLRGSGTARDTGRSARPRVA